MNRSANQPRSFPSRLSLALLGFALASLFFAAHAQHFQAVFPTPALDRWMYPYGDFDGTRPVANTWGSFDPRFDTRDGQFVLAWDTKNSISPGAPASQYLIRKARVTLTTAAPLTFDYDPTFDSFHTFQTNNPAYVPDSDLGRPVELFGAGFRAGASPATFLENSRFGALGPITGANISIGTRTVFAAMFDSASELVDVSNNVGQSNPDFKGVPFEVDPWAIGTTADAAPGKPVPLNARFEFHLNLADPRIVRYLQIGLQSGRLFLVASSLHPAAQSGFGGGGSYPQWYTKENLLGSDSTPARLEIEGALIQTTDSDNDRLPDDWERFWIGSLQSNGNDDPDGDGASNLAELAAGTDPTSDTSVLRVSLLGVDIDGHATLQFTTAPSRTYSIQRSNDLKDWGPGFGRILENNRGTITWKEDPPNVPPNRPVRGYYRVAVSTTP